MASFVISVIFIKSSLVTETEGTYIMVALQKLYNVAAWNCKAGCNHKIVVYYLSLHMVAVQQTLKHS
jgi:hypothetical protein